MTEADPVWDDDAELDPRWETLNRRLDALDACVADAAMAGFLDGFRVAYQLASSGVAEDVALASIRLAVAKHPGQLN